MLPHVRRERQVVGANAIMYNEKEPYHQYRGVPHNGMHPTASLRMFFESIGHAHVAVPVVKI